MLAADALISDLSSLIAEYDVLGRPVGLLRPEGGLELNEDRDWLAGTTMIDTPADLTRFLSGVRPAPAVAIDGQPDLGAGARIVEAIVQEFRLEQAAVLGVA
jgi:CDP-glycerol glycerophosphotransferase (TagB/SpsB family)